MAPNPAQQFCAHLVSGLAAEGVRHAMVSPGSRNTPLLMALHTSQLINVTVVHDERTAGFLALGAAKGSGAPTVLCCTSGSAAAHYLPAIIEASFSATPLVVLTTDRPNELHEVGAPQTIDQTNLYGSFTKWFFDPGVSDQSTASNATYLGARAAATATAAPGGVVHLNLPFREPLAPSAPLRVSDSVAPRVLSGRPTATEADLSTLSQLLSGKRILIVAGPSTGRKIGRVIADFADSADAVVFADPQSDYRFGDHDQSRLIGTADLLLAAELELEQPDAVIRIGGEVTSKTVTEWLRHLTATEIRIADGKWSDAHQNADFIVNADPYSTLLRLSKMVESSCATFSTEWFNTNRAARLVVDRTLGKEFSEATIARCLMETVPSGATVFAGSSMPIRLIDSYALDDTIAVAVVANRGANGIDGSIATSCGVARVAGVPTFALIGDITAFVDLASLVTARHSDVDLTVVVINNRGGGIFENLPQAGSPHISAEAFDLIRAPHDESIAALATGLGVTAHEVTTLDQLRRLLGTPGSSVRVIEASVPIEDVRQVRIEVVEALKHHLGT